MNFFKRLFKSIKATEVNASGVSTKPIVGPKTSDSIHHKVENRITLENDQVKLTEEEKTLLINQFTTGEKSLSNIETLDPLIIDSAKLIVMHQQASTSLIQRRLKLGYNRAGRIMEFLEKAGVVGPYTEPKGREVKIKTAEEIERLIKFGFNKVDLNTFYRDNKAEIEQKRLEYQEVLAQGRLKVEKEAIRQDLLEKERKKQLQREVYKELITEGKILNQNDGQQGRREPIPQDVMDKVWNRDGGKCVRCGSQEKLEFDHIIPFSKGGADTYRNLQIMCKKCNIEKSNNIG